MARAATRIRRASAGEAWHGVSDTGDLPGFELRNVGDGTPGTVGRVEGRELERPVSFLISDETNPGRIFVNHSIGPFEVQKHRAGGGMPSRPEPDPHVLLAQEIVRAHDVIDAFHL